ncbi:uncharacterized protein LOC130891041 isoform X1 [Diorhabda carinulata]|uniref:uncharacterized protein LOC130891041 isoform X1 n=1 Tax=Diorhabda carinulata TaxID=1163345 RepID=UPI0025A01A19|nr:uncharacterized protein LOC130891041 isoform X1 [Diorhabda carinulata]
MGQVDVSQDSSDSTKNSKDAFFDPKPKPKMIRVLTVLAYVLSVSMAAIFLSIYYIFMWHGEPHLGAHKNIPNSYIGSQNESLKVIEDVENGVNNTFSFDFNQEEEKTMIVTHPSSNEGMQQQITALELDESLSIPTRSENNSTTSTIRWQDDYNDSLESPKKSSMLIQKLWNEEKYEDTY